LQICNNQKRLCDVLQYDFSLYKLIYIQVYLLQYWFHITTYISKIWMKVTDKKLLELQHLNYALCIAHCIMELVMLSQDFSAQCSALFLSVICRLRLDRGLTSISHTDFSCTISWGLHSVIIVDHWSMVSWDRVCSAKVWTFT